MLKLVKRTTYKKDSEYFNFKENKGIVLTTIVDTYTTGNKELYSEEVRWLVDDKEITKGEYAKLQSESVWYETNFSKKIKTRIVGLKRV